MAKKKEMDNLAKDAAAALAAGISYGKWKALQENPVPEKKADGIPDGWKECKRCGKPFKPKATTQKYCEISCKREVELEKYRERHNERQRKYRERKKAEREEQAERMKLWAENLRKV